MSERDEGARRNRSLNRGLRRDLATFHIGTATTTDQTIKGVAAIAAVAGRDQRVSNVRTPKVADGAGAHILPRDLEALLVETPDHLLCPALAIDLARRGPDAELLRHRTRQPGQQVTLTRAVLGRQFDTSNNVDTMLGTGRLRLSDPLQRVVIRQGQHLNAALSSQFDHETRGMITIRCCRMRVKINSGRCHTLILLGLTA